MFFFKIFQRVDIYREMMVLEIKGIYREIMVLEVWFKYFYMLGIGKIKRRGQILF